MRIYVAILESVRAPVGRPDNDVRGAIFKTQLAHKHVLFNERQPIAFHLKNVDSMS